MTLARQDLLESKSAYSSEAPLFRCREVFLQDAAALELSHSAVVARTEQRRGVI
jgi:hypothetical protein